MTMASLYYWHYGFAVIFVDLRRTRIIRLLYVPDQPRKYVIKQLFPSKHAASQMTSSCKCPKWVCSWQQTFAGGCPSKSCWRLFRSDNCREITFRSSIISWRVCLACPTLTSTSTSWLNHDYKEKMVQPKDDYMLNQKMINLEQREHIAYWNRKKSDKRTALVRPSLLFFTDCFAARSFYVKKTVKCSRCYS